MRQPSLGSLAWIKEDKEKLIPKDDKKWNENTVKPVKL
jgi:hypothetical protein